MIVLHMLVLMQHIPIGPKTKVIDIHDKFVSPGFADPHLHIDQFVLPSEFAKQALSLWCNFSLFRSN